MFIKSVENFKHKPAFDVNERFAISSVGPYSFVGLEELTQNSERYLSSMKCVSQKGKTFAILKEHFEIILKQKYRVLSDQLHILSAQRDLEILDRIQHRGVLKQHIQ